MIQVAHEPISVQDQVNTNTNPNGEILGSAIDVSGSGQRNRNVVDGDLGWMNRRRQPDDKVAFATGERPALTWLNFWL